MRDDLQRIIVRPLPGVVSVGEHADAGPAPVDAVLGDEPVADLHHLDDVHLVTATAHLRRLVEGGPVVVRSRAKGGELKLFTLPGADTAGLDSPVELRQ
jgi:hypothetical protein